MPRRAKSKKPIKWGFVGRITHPITGKRIPLYLRRPTLKDPHEVITSNTRIRQVGNVITEGQGRKQKRVVTGQTYDDIHPQRLPIGTHTEPPKGRAQQEFSFRDRRKYSRKPKNPKK